MRKLAFLVTGGSGFIGTQLVKELLLEGHEVTVLTRDCSSTANHFANVMANTGEEGQDINRVRVVDNLKFSGDDTYFNVIINLAGQGIADRRWTDAVKQQLLDSRINSTKALYTYIKDATTRPETFISGSALGFYGLREHDAPVDEDGQSDNSFSSQLCVAWENEAQRIQELGVRTCYLRTGIVLGRDGGALAKMLPAFKVGLGGSMGSGLQWMSWVHMSDLLGMIHYAIDNSTISGAINATAPNPVINKEFSRILGKVLKRPVILPMPAFLLKLMMGEMAEELLLSGQRIIPKKMMQAGFKFRFVNLEDALQDILS